MRTPCPSRQIARQPLADEAMHLRHIGRRRRQAGADRPDRLIGDHQRAAVAPSGTEPSSCAPTTSSVRRRSRSSLRLADADDRHQPGAPRGLRLGAHLCVGLVVVGAPLRMADDHRARAGIGEHFGRNIAGERARRLGMAILRADRRPWSPAPRRKGQHQRRGRTDHQIDCADRPAAPWMILPSSAAEALSPFIFQLPATSGRRPCDMVTPIAKSAASG